MGIKDTITAKAKEILKSEQNGIRYSNLVRKIKEATDANENTIHGSIWNLDERFPNEIYKPARGIFRSTIYSNNKIAAQEVSVSEESATRENREREKRFYQPFADWLVQRVQECTKAISLGGSSFGGKWGTPDVVGILEPKASDIIKPSTEIVSAEIKADTGSLITAFGQACSYKLFSHRAYIVIPNSSPDEDKVKLDALCEIFGIGLVLHSGDHENPDFEIMVRASKHEPDSFYANDIAKKLEGKLF